ncbi:hypothetical protein AB0451_38205 [Streptomyces sp. NPDC052000]|uniref:hypothetical protein n=1 Tax=Streptomyces sp. NPDC052000 TaxID=3155676 RepID=UPI00344F7FAE
MILLDRVPEPVTVIVDRRDDQAFTAALLASHHLAQGRITVHPPPPRPSPTDLAYEILEALGKPVALLNRGRWGAAPPWAVAAAWIAGLPVTRLTVLRAHLLPLGAWTYLLRLREATAVPLTVVFHCPRSCAAHRVLDDVPHILIDDLEAVRRLHPPAPPTSRTHYRTPGRWITLPALDRLPHGGYFPDCLCRHPPPAVISGIARLKPLTPAVLREIAHRLATRTAHPYLAGALATAIFTAAAESQLATVRLHDYDPSHSELALHDPKGVTHQRRCATHTVPAWARSFLTVTGHLTLAAAPRAGAGRLRLFQPPAFATTPLTEFTEQCRLRPPHPWFIQP